MSFPKHDLVNIYLSWTGSPLDLVNNNNIGPPMCKKYHNMNEYMSLYIFLGGEHFALPMQIFATKLRANQVGLWMRLDVIFCFNSCQRLYDFACDDALFRVLSFLICFFGFLSLLSLTCR